MKLINYRQTNFITNKGYNKIIFEFDALENGASFELLGIKKIISSKTFGILVPEVKQEICTNAILTVPERPTSVIPIRLKPVKKTCVNILCFSEFTNQTFFSSHPNHYAFSDDFSSDKEFMELAKNGNLEINAINSKIHTHHLYGEALVRSLYRVRDIKNLLGINPETAILTEPSGLSSAAVTGLIDAGVKNLIILRSDHNNCRLNPDIPELFRLHPKNHSRYLNTLIINQELPDFTPQIIKTRSCDTYLFDRISLKKLNSSQLEEKIEAITKDTESPVFYSRFISYSFALCDFIKSNFKNPEFRTITPTSLMEHLKSLNSGNIPHLYGEISDCNADALSFTANAKKQMFSLPTEETCSTLRLIDDKSFVFPKDEITTGYNTLEQFFSGDKDANKLINPNSLISPFFKTGKSDSVITLINPTPYPKPACGKLPDLKPYQFKHFITSDLLRSKTKILKNDVPSFETDYYTVSYNQENGKIISIVDKSHMRELIDFKSPYSLCDCIGTSSQTEYIIQQTEAETTIYYQNSQTKSSITFYKNNKSIDINMQISDLSSNSNIVIAVPVLCDNGDFYTENHNIFTNELTDRLRINSNDFSVVSSMAVVDNGKCGMAVITPDAPMVYFGDVKHSKSSTDYSNTSSTVFISTKSEESLTELKIRLFPYTGSLNQTLIPALDFIHPTIKSKNYLTLKNKIIINSENIILITFKPAEDNRGYILRLFEAHGTKTESSVIMPFKISKAYYDNIIEEDLHPNTAFEKNKIYFTADPNCYITLRIIP